MKHEVDLMATDYCFLQRKWPYWYL